METLSAAASVLQLIAFFGSVLKATVSAFDAANTLQQFEKDAQYMCLSLKASIIIVQNICLLNEKLDTFNEYQLQQIRVPVEQMELHLLSTIELRKCLQKRNAKLASFFGALKVNMSNAFFQGENDVENCWARFLKSQNCLSLFLSTLQFRTTVSTFERLGDFAQSTGSQLNEISTMQQSSVQTIASVHSGVQAASQNIHKLDISLNRAARQIKSLSQKFNSNHGARSVSGATRQLPSFSPPKTLFKVPYSRNRWFTGRRDVLSQISNCLLPAKGTQADLLPHRDKTDESRIFVLSGLPGIGKTHTAIEFCYQHKNDFQYIFWIATDSPEKLEHGYMTIAKALQLTSAAAVQDNDKIIQLTREWLAGGEHGGRSSSWLLVLDNVDDFSILQSSWSDFQYGAVLITSRDKMPALQAISGHSQSTQMIPMTSAEGISLFRKRLVGRPTLNEQQIGAWADKVDRFPLYLERVVSFIEESNASLDALFCASNGSSENPSSDLQDLAQVAPNNSPWYNQSLTEALAASISKLNDTSRQVLTTVALFDPDQIPEQLLVSLDDRVPALRTPIRSKNIMLSLSRRSFVYLQQEEEEEQVDQHQPHSQYVWMHRLVCDVALEQEPHIQSAFEDATSLLRQAFPLHGPARDHMVERWDTCETFQPHVLSLHKHYLKLRGMGRLSWTSSSSVSSLSSLMDFVELVYSCAWYLCERGRFSISKTLIATAHEAYSGLQVAASSPDSREIVFDGKPGLFLADLYTVQLYFHNETEAEEVGVAGTAGLSLAGLAAQALKIREDAVKAGLLDVNHPNLANGFMNLGVVLAGDNPWEAIKMHQIALEIRQGTDKYRADQHHGLALNHLNIGRCWWVVKELDRAAVCFQSCIALMLERETAMQKRFPLTSWAKAALALVLIDKGELLVAEELLLDSVALHKETLGEKHMKTLSCSYRLAWIWHRLGDFNKSKNILQFCLDAYCAMPSFPKAEIARTKFKLAQVQEDLGLDNGQHEQLRRDSRQLLAEIVGPQADSDVSEADFDAAIAYYIR